MDWLKEMLMGLQMVQLMDWQMGWQKGLQMEMLMG